MKKKSKQEESPISGLENIPIVFDAFDFRYSI
jgi:hypothetical protein